MHENLIKTFLSKNLGGLFGNPPVKSYQSGVDNSWQNRNRSSCHEEVEIYRKPDHEDIPEGHRENAYSERFNQPFAKMSWMLIHLISYRRYVKSHNNGWKPTTPSVRMRHYRVYHPANMPFNKLEFVYLSLV